MENEVAQKIAETLHSLAKKVYLETGKNMIIGYCIEDGEELVEGAVSAEEVDYKTSCMMAMGITTAIQRSFSGNINCDDCEDKKPWQE